VIVIYERDDLEATYQDGACFQPPQLSDVDPDLLSPSFSASTVYIARRDGRFQMTKAVNAPLDPYPVRIVVSRVIQDEL